MPKTLPERKWVMDYIAVLKRQFHLQGYEISVLFKDEDVEIGAAADCTPDWRYRRAHLNVYPLFFKEPKENWRGILKHEFVHIVLSQLLLIISGLRNGHMVTEGELESAHEHVTTWIETIIETSPEDMPKKKCGKKRK